MNLRQSTRITLIWGAGFVGVTLISLLLWLLLAGLGDERGAAAAQIVAICGIVGVVTAQILLVTLLALGSLRVKMSEDASA